MDIYPPITAVPLQVEAHRNMVAFDDRDDGMRQERGLRRGGMALISFCTGKALSKETFCTVCRETATVRVRAMWEAVMSIVSGRNRRVDREVSTAITTTIGIVDCNFASNPYGKLRKFISPQLAKRSVAPRLPTLPR